MTLLGAWLVLEVLGVIAFDHLWPAPSSRGAIARYR